MTRKSQDQYLSDQDFRLAAEAFNNATRHFDTGDKLVVLFELMLPLLIYTEGENIDRATLEDRFFGNVQCVIDNYFTGTRAENIVKLPVQNKPEKD